MTFDDSALALLACPRCGASLRRTEGLSCDGCAASYSFIGDIPCLPPEPAFWRARVVQRLDEYLDFSAGRLADLEREQRTLPLLPRTRARLARISEALTLERQLIQRLMAPVRAGSLSMRGPAAFTDEPMTGTLELLTCYENVFRDWCWGEVESNNALRLVQELLELSRPPERLQRLAMFGAGAGRLAADLHAALLPAHTLALDLNPLPLMFAEQLVRGESFDAREFPIAPRNEAEVAVPRLLRCPFPVPPGLLFLFADALSAPLAASSQQAVITPWFIDAVGADPRVTAAAVNRVLEPGGLWINFGPLRFNGPTSRLYAIEEVMDIVNASGFETCAELNERVPYFAFSESGFQRQELVYGFAARKLTDTPGLSVPPVEPAWLLDVHSPVPVLDLWENVRKSAAIADGLLQHVDGQRSIADLADLFGQSSGVEPRTLDSHLQAYLARFLPR